MRETHKHWERDTHLHTWEGETVKVQAVESSAINKASAHVAHSSCVARTKPAQAQAKQNPSMEPGYGHEVPPLAEESLPVD